MSLEIHIGKPSLKLMLDLINETNGLVDDNRLTLEQVTIAPPVPKEDESPEINAAAVISAVPGEGYTDNVTTDYFQLDIATLFSKNVVRLDVEGAVSTVDLLQRLNEKYRLEYFKCPLGTEEIVDSPIDYSNVESDGVGHDIVVSGSFIFTGTLHVIIGPEQIKNAIRWEDGRLMRWEDGSIMKLEQKSVS